MVALSYFPKIGVTHDKVLSAIAKKNWEYLLANGIMVTVKCLPGILNAETDHKSRSVSDSGKWKLNPLIFKKISKVFWTLNINLFVSRRRSHNGNIVLHPHDLIKYQYIKLEDRGSIQQRG